ncbi:hypothetical protein [Demequina sp. NBRC 110055]|uniref:hypothetical protein n=1 Tax=Demequina sp. NBRC 110055 TaxID=1570344 RepID=UPI000A0204BA|nr:hypothetical protein [Demequina sp. NBRC 110055]
MLATFVAVILLALLAALAVFQIALASGAPLGSYAFGGQHEGTLPWQWRIASAVTVVVYAVMAWITLEAAGVTDLTCATTDTAAIWILTAILALNIVPNAISRSRHERATMTPVVAIMAVAALVLALNL